MDKGNGRSRRPGPTVLTYFDIKTFPSDGSTGKGKILFCVRKV